MAEYNEWYCQHRQHHKQCKYCNPDPEPKTGKEAFEQYSLHQRRLS